MKNKNLTGERIRKLRRSQIPPLSQADLARAASSRGAPLSQDAISLIEHGLRSVSDIELVIIAKCLNVSAATLLGERRKST